MIIIGGATATGKSHVAIALAKAIGGELISCDSAQVYKGMDVGTAKENGDIGVNQHLIDLVEPCESFTVVDFRTLAREKILEIRSRGNVPIIVGGTGLYIDSLFDIDRPAGYYKFDVLQVPPDKYIVNLGTSKLINYAHFLVRIFCIIQ